MFNGFLRWYRSQSGIRDPCSTHVHDPCSISEVIIRLECADNFGPDLPACRTQLLLVCALLRPHLDLVCRWLDCMTCRHAVTRSWTTQDNCQVYTVVVVNKDFSEFVRAKGTHFGPMLQKVCATPGPDWLSTKGAMAP